MGDTTSAPERLVVAAQSPPADTILTAGTVVTLTVQDTTQPAPALTIVMPNVRDTAMITATILLDRLRGIVPFSITRTLVPPTGRAFDSTHAIVESQSPDANTPLVAQSTVQLVLRDTTTVLLPSTDTGPRIPWPWIVGGLLLAAAAGSAGYVRTGQQRLARVAVVPRPDPTPPRMKFRMHSGETADEAFGRLGFSIKPFPHAGAATLTRVTLPPDHGHDHG